VLVSPAASCKYKKETLEIYKIVYRVLHKLLPELVIFPHNQIEAEVVFYHVNVL